MTFLCDVNLLIALIDPTHVFHPLAHEWFAAEGHDDWATCPLTENGVVRIVGRLTYPNSPGGPAAVAAVMARLCDHPGHVFWPDEISLLRSPHIAAGRIATASQVTDTYLLALAAFRGGRLATLDRRLATGAVRDGDSALRLIS